MQILSLCHEISNPTFEYGGGGGGGGWGGEEKIKYH